MKIILRNILLLFLAQVPMFGQGDLHNKKADSLVNRLRQNLPDTEKAKICSKLGRMYMSRDLTTSMSYFRQSLSLYEKSDARSRAGRVYSLMGNALVNHGSLDSALWYYGKGYQYAIDEKDTLSAIYAEMNAGTAYFMNTNYNKALEYFLQALRWAEKVHSVGDITRCLGNIGSVYKEQSKFREALEYYAQSRKYDMEQRNQRHLAVNYVNAGNVYFELYKQGHKSVYLDSAYYLYTLGESTLMAEPDSSVLAMLYGNIGNVFTEKKQYAQAIALYLRAIAVKTRLGEESQIPLIYENLASCYLEMNLPDKALPYIVDGLKMAEEDQSYEDMSNLYKAYSEYYKDKKDHVKAYEYYVKYKQYADSVINDANIEKRKELEMNYAFDKERERNLLEQREQEVLRKEEKKRSQLYIAITVGGLVISIVIGLIIFRNLRQMKRAHRIISEQKNQIERQKHLVEEKQKEILDSIHYARRIQHSLLTSEKYIARQLMRMKEKS